MSKLCKNCGEAMPEEANFCLNCLTVYESHANITEQKTSFVFKIKDAIHNINKKRTATFIAAVICFAFILPIALSPFFSKDVTPISAEENKSKNVQQQSDTPKIETFILEKLGIEKEETSKENVKKEEKTTKKKGLFSNNHTKNTNKKDSSSSTTGTTTSTVPNHNGGSSDNTPINSTSPSVPNPPSNPQNPATRPTTTNPNNENKNEQPPNETTTDKETPILNLDDYKYKETEKGIEITKYIGNSKSIIIPDKIDGKNVVRICENTFENNKTLKYVKFKDSEKYHTLWVNPRAFKNCTALKEITFPKNTDLGILSMFAQGCTALDSINVEHYQYKFADGALYYYNTKSWVLYYYCEGYKSEKYVVPHYCQSLSACTESLGNNKYLKKIYLNDRDCRPLYRPAIFPYLEGVYATDSNYYYDINGVLFEKGDKEDSLAFYPTQNKQKTFTFPNNCYASLSYRMNAYVETLVIPDKVRFYQNDIEHLTDCFTNLKTIKISKKNPQLQLFKDYFTETIIIY